MLSIYTSAFSKFIVDGKSLYIHGQLVSRHSKPLSAKINARKDYTIIDGVDKDTFVRFIDWAYKGYYTAAEYQIDAESPTLSKFEDSDACTPEAEPNPPDKEPVGPEPEVTEPSPVPAFKNSWGQWNFHNAEPAAPPVEEPAPPPAPAFEDFEYWGSSGKTKSKKDKKKSSTVQEVVWDVPRPLPKPQPPPKSSKETLEESFFARENSIREDSISLPTPRPNQSPNENYTPIFLSHAHLYIFAFKYAIPSLKTLALENLHTTLKEFTLHPERTGDIIELLRYIYGSSELKDGGGEVEDMREMLKGYIGFQMDVLMKDREFRGLMKEEGELLEDFVEMVGKRI